MMQLLRTGGIALARFLLSMMFLSSAMSKILHWQQQETELLNVLSEWLSYVAFSEELQDFFAGMIPWTTALLALGALLEFVGGLLVLLGIRERLGAAFLVLFLIPQTIVMYQFWFFDGAMRELQMTYFLKNLAILGGLFLFLLQGAPKSAPKFSPIKLG